MHILPFGDRILVVKDAVSEKTDGGIIIKPESDDSITRTGVVKAIGKSADKNIKVGDRVLFNKYGGVACKNEQLLLKQDEILAIIES